jgi:hypothetical protein
VQLDDLVVIGTTEDDTTVEVRTDENVLSFLEFTQESETAYIVEYIRAEAPANVNFGMSENYSAVQVLKAVGEYHRLHQSDLKVNLIVEISKKNLQCS